MEYREDLARFNSQPNQLILSSVVIPENSLLQSKTLEDIQETKPRAQNFRKIRDSHKLIFEDPIKMKEVQSEEKEKPQRSKADRDPIEQDSILGIKGKSKHPRELIIDSKVSFGGSEPTFGESHFENLEEEIHSVKPVNLFQMESIEEQDSAERKYKSQGRQERDSNGSRPETKTNFGIKDSESFNQKATKLSSKEDEAHRNSQHIKREFKNIQKRENGQTYNSLIQSNERALHEIIKAHDLKIEESLGPLETPSKMENNEDFIGRKLRESGVARDGLGIIPEIHTDSGNKLHFQNSNRKQNSKISKQRTELTNEQLQGISSGQNKGNVFYQAETGDLREFASGSSKSEMEVSALQNIIIFRFHFI